MLRKPQDSPNVKSFKQRVERIEEEAAGAAGRIRDFIRLPGRRIIAYHRQGYLAASTLYWMASTLDSWADNLLGEAGSLAYYTIPYSEPGSTILFTTSPGSPATIQFLQAASLTGSKTLLLTIDPGNQALKEILGSYNPYYTGLRDELEASLAYAIAAYNAAAQEYSDRLGRRGERLSIHSAEGFTSITGSLLEKYMDTIWEITGMEEIIVTSTSINEAASHYMVEALRRRGIHAYYEPLEYVSGPGNILLIASSVEEYLLRERRRSIALTGGRLIELLFNTDPLETPIYVAIISLYIAGRDKDN